MGMVRKFLGFCVVLCAYVWAIDAAGPEKPKTQGKEFNRLNWIELLEGRISSFQTPAASSFQVMFDFKDSIYCKKKIVKDKHQLLLMFPGMNMQSFDKNYVLEKLEPLKKNGLVSAINIFEKKEGTPTVVLLLQFASATQNTDSKTEQPRQFVIKWCTLTSPFRLILDIYLKETLDNLSKNHLYHNDAAYLHASTNTYQYDSYSYPQKPAQKNAPLRIVLDPGHGGANTGARGNGGIIEKKLTLDIAQQVHKMLKDEGLTSYLTRTTDEDVSLYKRVELASQLKANLFISIHVNAHLQPTGQPNPNAAGIETFYLDGEELLPKKSKTGMLFVNMDKDEGTVEIIKKGIQENLSKAKHLAQSIQNSLLTTLQKKYGHVINRGVKKASFRVLLQTEIPAILIEVGFATNPEEAKRLATPLYRTLVARGIVAGLRTYLNTANN